MSTFARRTYLRLLDDRSYQLPQSANFASRTQPRPRGTLIADQRRACAARPKGKYSRERMALAPIRARRIFPATGHARSQLFRLPTSFNQLSRHNAAFFDSFLVRPALLPYGKRGFRAAIYKIARPQPPAAALWLQESTVLLVSLVPLVLPPHPAQKGAVSHSLLEPF